MKQVDILNKLTKITLITCTGARQDSFAVCEQMMKRQTVWGKISIQWLVVDDCEPPTKTIVPEITYSTGPKMWQPGWNTQRYNLDSILKNITGDYIFFIEDDDCYMPNYLEKYLELLQSKQIVGEGNAKYYLLRDKGYWKEMGNYNHASLCQTAFRKELLPMFTIALHSGELYFDIKLWELARKAKVRMSIFTEENLSIGVKGVKGRPGIGSGHVKKGYAPDWGYKKLEEWFKIYRNYYKQFIGERGANTQKETKIVREGDRKLPEPG